MLARYLPQEGSTTHIYTLSKALVARGHKVAIASSGHNGSEGAIAIYEKSIADGVDHIKMPFPLKPSFGMGGKLKQAIQYLSALPVAYSKISAWKPDVIHVHYPVVSFLADFYRRRTGKRYVMTYHISGILKHPLHRKADVAIAISTSLQKEIINDFKYDADKVVLVHNGVEIERFRNVKNRDRESSLRSIGLERYSDKTIIGFLGSINQRKGLDVLLRAAAQLDRNSFHIVLVGDGNRQWLDSLIAETGMGKSVSVFNFADPEPFYAAFDVFVLPSRKEGFPLVAIESMVSGILTIRSNTEGAEDQIDHGVTGYLFENENDDQLHSILHGILREKDVNKTIAAAGQHVAIERFSVDSMVNKTEEIYRNLA